MATLTLRRAAITCSRGPKGMKAWQLLLDWLTPAERSRLTRAAVGLCREVRWVRTVARNTHTNTKKCYNKLPCMILRLPSSPWPLKNTHHYHLGWGVGHDMNYSAKTGHLLTNYMILMLLMMMMMILPSPGKRWPFPVRANDGVWPL